MNNLEKYFGQMEQLLQKMIQDGEIDEYDDGTEKISIHQFEVDPDKIKAILVKKPELKEFYDKPQQIRINEISKNEDEDEDEYNEQLYEEEYSMRILAEYLKKHPKFQSETLETSTFSECIINRFRSISSQTAMKLKSGLQIPYIENLNIAKLKRVRLGDLYYDPNKDSFILNANDGCVKETSIYRAMPLVYDYLYQILEVQRTKNLDDFPEMYKKEPTYINRENGKNRQSDDSSR